MATLGVFRDDFYNAISVLPQSQYKTTTQNGGTLVAANMCGAGDCYLAASGQTAAQAVTTDSAVNIINQLLAATAGQAVPTGNGIPNTVSVTWTLTIINNNTSSGQITLTGGAGVTITGTNTIAITTSRIYLCTITGPSTITMQNVGSGTV